MTRAGLVLALALAGCASGAEPRHRETPDDPGPTSGPAFGREPVQIHGSFPVSGPTSESAARRFLERNATAFRLDPSERALTLGARRTGRAGEYLRFQQQMDEMPVFGAEVVVLVAGSGDAFRVRAVNLAHRSPLRERRPKRDVGRDRAVRAALAVAGGGAAVRVAGVERGWVARDDGTAMLVHRVALVGVARDWEVDVSAESGEAISQRDLRVHVTGSGMVFDPSLVAVTGDTSFVDNADATTPATNAARVSVALPRLDGSGYLRGSYVDAKNPSSRAQSGANTFDFDRSDDRFEEVMAYFHFDRAQNRIQADLGFSNVNNRVQVVVVNDAALGDNSFYSSVSKELHYGSGGVDDAEDADILLHEYAHAILDNQVPGWGAGADSMAISEGFGDYFAASFNNTLSAEVTDPLCIADWDAVVYSSDTPPCLRRLDTTKHYPEHADGEVHDDGEMWSATLWRIRNAFGADVVDALTLESHFILTTSETFESAVSAILGADDSLFSGAHYLAVRREFVWQGLSRTLTSPAIEPYVVGSDFVSIDNSRSGGFAPNTFDETKTVTAAGAAAIVVHFTSISTELDAQCFAGSCDDVYLYDGNGDLFQILNGTRSDVSSVQIPGDTVKIRLVTDLSTGSFGYHVDRIDRMGASLPEAGTDAGADASDAAGSDGAAEALPVESGMGGNDAALGDSAADTPPALDTGFANDAGATSDVGGAGGGGPADTGVKDASRADARERDVAEHRDVGSVDARSADAAAPSDARSSLDAVADARREAGDADSSKAGADQDAGCGCRVHSGNDSRASLVLLLISLGAAGRRRKKPS